MRESAIEHILGLWSCLWLFALAGIVLAKAVATGAGLGGMLRESDGGPARLDRLQLLGATALGLLYYATAALKAGPGDTAIPDLPRALLWALAGSHGLYLAAKAKRTIDITGDQT